MQAAQWAEPHQLNTLANACALTVEEVHALREEFMKLSGLHGDSFTMTRDQVSELVTRVTPVLGGEAIQRALDLHDRDGSGAFDFREVCCLLSALTTAPLDQKLRLLFESFDLDNSGYLEQQESNDLLKALLKTIDVSEKIPDAYSGSIDVVGGLTERDYAATEASASPSSQHKHASLTPELLQAARDNVMFQTLYAQLQSFDLNGDGRISREEWLQAAQASPEILHALGFLGGADGGERQRAATLALRQLHAAETSNQAQGGNTIRRNSGMLRERCCVM